MSVEQLRDEAWQTAHEAMQALASAAVEEAAKPQGHWGFGRMREALAIAEYQAGRALGLAEAAAVAGGQGIAVDDPAWRAVPVLPEAPGMLRRGLRLVASQDAVPAAVPGPWDDRNDAIADMRRNLRRRSGKDWTVRGGESTSWQWITICSPPARREAGGISPEAERIELQELLGLDGPAHRQGVLVRPDNRREFVLRARGEWDGPPTKDY